MNKPLAFLITAVATLPFIGCSLDQSNPRDTVFHQTENSPRDGGSAGSSRYGHGGTHSPSERSGRTTKKTRNTSRRRSAPSDPDGIVKPRDLDPEPSRNDSPSDEPEIVSSNTPNDDPKPEMKDPPATTPAPSGDAPYAEAVPGKYGLVYSPFVTDKKNGLVNVTDENNVPLPPGTEVTDPHTGKTFRVP